MTDEKTITFKDLPKKAVDEVFDRLMTEHRYNFSKTGTNYKDNNGSFEKYLIKKTAITTNVYADAEAKVRKDAEALVKELVTIYLYAGAYEVTYTEDELKEYKNDGTGAYDQGVYYNGEMFTLAAFQFDKLFNNFLKSETNEETGAVTYTNELIKFTFKAEEDKK